MISVAFLTGLFSSLHCLGMCGPIALAIPSPSGDRFRFVSSRLLYNFGRITTYALLGAIIGLLGIGIQFGGLQQALSITLGLAILIGAFLSISVEQKLLQVKALDRALLKLRRSMSRLLARQGQPAHFGLGLLNGLLPCGFVYLALSGALLAGNSLDSAVYMMTFGLGTLPMMFGISLLSGKGQALLKKRYRPILNGFIIVFGCFLLLRGMGLGIPFLSPELGPIGDSVAGCN